MDAQRSLSPFLLLLIEINEWPSEENWTEEHREEKEKGENLGRKNTTVASDRVSCQDSESSATLDKVVENES